MIDLLYMKDKADEQTSAKEEHIREMLVEFVDQILFCFDDMFYDRDDIINIIEKFVTKRRRWL